MKFTKISYYTARRIFFSAFVSVSLIAVGAAFSAVTALDRYGAIMTGIEEHAAKYADATADLRDGGCFLVREHEGIIGVFSADGRLEYTVEVYVKTLPEADRLLLKNGIHARDRDELLSILGDYNA